MSCLSTKNTWPKQIQTINKYLLNINETLIDESDRILAVFIYSKDDPNISTVVGNGFRLAELMDKYLPTK